MKLTAQKVPYSSVVGQSVLLKNEEGAVVAQLSIMIPNVITGRHPKALQIEVADAVVAAFSAPQIRPLDWVETFTDRGDGQQEATGWEADSGFGSWYSIKQYFGSDSYGWAVEFECSVFSDKDDPDDAKAAAQADFEDRVRRLRS